MLSKKDINHLTNLARIGMDDKNKESEEKTLSDLGRILEYFDELKEVDTESVRPMEGGTSLEDVYRNDEVEKKFNTEASVGQFPESESGFLKIPPVFSDE